MAVPGSVGGTDPPVRALSDIVSHSEDVSVSDLAFPPLPPHPPKHTTRNVVSKTDRFYSGTDLCSLPFARVQITAGAVGKG